MPNVKLRPPDAQASSRLLRDDEIYDEQCLVQDSQANTASSSSFGVCPRPFAGVILCATGVEKVCNPYLDRYTTLRLNFRHRCSKRLWNLVQCASPLLRTKSHIWSRLTMVVQSTRYEHASLFAHLRTDICYQCALERKIPILLPSWVDESYEVWLRGDDVDLEKVSSRGKWVS